MLRITTKINDELIDIREFAKPNACFQTNEYPDSYDFCILHEQFNPYDLFNDNKIKDKENERLNKTIKNQEFLLKSQGVELKEIYSDRDRLNNIIEEFDKWLEKYSNECGIDERITLKMVGDKLKELNGGK